MFFFSITPVTHVTKLQSESLYIVSLERPFCKHLLNIFLNSVTCVTGI